MKKLKAVVAFVASMALVASIASIAFVLWPLPADMVTRQPSLGMVLQDRHGLPLRATRAGDGSRAGWIAIEDVDPRLIQAFVAVEDRRFFAHGGVDLRALGRAFLQDVRARRVVSGASTITMQLARLLRPLPRSVPGKVAQALWAWRLERHLTKQEILEQYLNRIPLGEGTVGVGAAAALYTGRSAASVSLGGAGLLAGLASAPSSASPVRSPLAAAARRDLALRRMLARGYITADELARAGAEPVLASGGPPPFVAPHFTTRAVQWALDSGLAQGGAIRTSLDAALQAELEAEVRHTVELLKESEVRQAAAVVLDNATGEILAWVGSPDFFADSTGQVDMVVSPRQPGSALKPFLYALAFDRGVTAATVLPDIPRTWRTATGPYQPRNYDRRFHGPVRAREALASSFNIPAVELTDRLGPGTVLRTLHAAGFASLDRGADTYGLGLSLGNGDVTLLELANAYRALANGGTWRPVRWRMAPGGAEPAAGIRAVSAHASLLVLDILADPVARIPGFGTDTPFDFPFPVAVKTGTSHHFTDNWAVGVTGAFTVAVWAGNFSGRPMRRISGVTGAGPLLHRAVLDVARRYDPGVLPTPAERGARRVTICRLSGMRAGPECPTADEWFFENVPTAICDWHRHGTVVLPAAYSAYAGDERDEGDEGDERDEGIRILSPRDGDRYEIPAGVDARYATIPLRADRAVRWFVDGRETRADRWPLASGRHSIRAVSESGESAEARIWVR